MGEEKLLEIVIDDADETVVKSVEDSLVEVRPVRNRKARHLDPVVVLGIAAGAVKLVNELLALKKSLADRGELAKVKVRNLEGESLDLSSADAESLTKLTE
jgi:hypothetical protein